MRVLEDEAAARRAWEPIDVENQVVVFYSEDGIWLEPYFTKPNRYRLFGLILDQGKFELRANPNLPPAVDSFDVALSCAAAVEPNPRFEDLAAIRHYVEARRSGAHAPSGAAQQ